MCGIAMIANSTHTGTYTSIKQNSLFKDMLLASAVRGTDSTGIFQITPDNRVWYGKTAEPSGAALKNEYIEPLLSDVHKSAITVGHVRAATAGEVNVNNAHPFIGKKNNEGKDYIIGVHNGTLWGWESMDTYNRHDVDSSWAIEQIATRGLDAFEDFYGAYALLWYDTEHPNKLFIARNDERTFYVARSKDKSTIFGASEAGMLQWLAARNGMELEDADPFSIDDGFLFSIDTSEKELSIALVKELPEYNTYASYKQQGWRPATPSSNVSATVMPLAPVSYTSAKTNTVEAVKLALKRARYSAVDPVEDDNDTPFEMGPTEILTRAQDDWFNTGDMSKDDIKRAMYDGSYGSVVMFEAVAHDNFTDSVVGEITYPSFYKRPITYLENVSPFEWGEYEKKTVPMVVAGVKFFNNEKEYIVVPLNEKGMEAMAV